MSKKRRIFDIDMPDESDGTFPAGKAPELETKSLRRGPMATAIGENAEALKARREIEAEIRAENDTLAAEHVRLKKQGLIVDLVPLGMIDTNKLIRDRHSEPDMELAELMDSIKAIGLSNPIKVEQVGERYELVQGMRRLSAYRALAEADERFASIPASLVAQGEELEALYRRMVDENLVRKDISFAEMADLAIAYAADPGTACEQPEKAVAILYKSASYTKRSYIRTFIPLMDRLGDALDHAAYIPRSLGLALAKRMDEVEGIPAAIKTELKGWDNRSVPDELDVLRKFAGVGESETFPVAKASKPQEPRKAKTTFQLVRPEGAAKCTASNGRLEVRLPLDFSAVERRKLEAAVQGLLDQLA